MVNSFPAVDSRPGVSQFEEVRTVFASGCTSRYTLKSGHYFPEPRVFGSRLLTVSVLLQKSLSFVRHRWGGGGRWESRLPGDPPPISLRDCCIIVTAVDKHTVEHV